MLTLNSSFPLEPVIVKGPNCCFCAAKGSFVRVQVVESSIIFVVELVNNRVLF